MIPENIKSKWRRVDEKCRPYWWAFALAFLFALW